ncbi:hypothetical protein E2C01_059487 [Portunus trituberculatus]|uniref:Uncharacterized protein n=1 Tax=Portunus trituberculatus TaxID=210409 RepID=A0A5B7H5H4_PORTR|nr:hypothetical protein [Portunus trituberculatus]
MWAARRRGRGREGMGSLGWVRRERGRVERGYVGWGKGVEALGGSVVEKAGREGKVGWGVVEGGGGGDVMAA